MLPEKEMMLPRAGTIMPAAMAAAPAMAAARFGEACCQEQKHQCEGDVTDHVTASIQRVWPPKMAGDPQVSIWTEKFHATVFYL